VEALNLVEELVSTMEFNSVNYNTKRTFLLYI